MDLKCYRPTTKGKGIHMRKYQENLTQRYGPGKLTRCRGHSLSASFHQSDSLYGLLTSELGDYSMFGGGLCLNPSISHSDIPLLLFYSFLSM